jgi:hypothetical protein
MSESIQDPKAAFLAFLAERFPMASGPRPDPASVERLRAIAASWHEASQHFYAGYALRQAIHFAWGDGDAVKGCSLGALREFEHAVTDTNAAELEVAASLWMWALEVGMNYRHADPSSVRGEIRALEEELAQRLIHIADQADDPLARAGFLVRGFRLETDFGDAWRPEFPESEVDHDLIMTTLESLALMMPSAFRLFVLSGDYVAADSVARACPEGFTSHGLNGWRAAVTGFLTPEKAVERFMEAAEEFSKDTYEAAPRVGGWSSANIDLWAKYFRARAAVAEIVRSPDRATALLNQARDALEGTDSGWVNPQVTCFRILVHALEQIFDEGDTVAAVTEAKEILFREANRVGFDENDRLAVDFLDAAASAFDEIWAEPAKAWVSGRLRDALQTLGRIPLVGEEIASAIQPAVGERALAMQISGQNRTWIYRTIEGIKDETVLQRLLLRLMQAQLPLYAQVRHGPIEYGKDIVALVDRDGHYILLMYQAKAGDITKANWPKARDELEEMFQVDMSAVQMPVGPDDREGILVFNGHLNPYVEPVVDGWLQEQRKDHRRTFTIMHLDSIVRWIVNKNLLSDLREALAELGIAIATIEHDDKHST